LISDLIGSLYLFSHSTTDLDYLCYFITFATDPPNFDFFSYSKEIDPIYLLTPWFTYSLSDLIASYLLDDYRGSDSKYPNSLPSTNSVCLFSFFLKNSSSEVFFLQIFKNFQRGLFNS
jgi:hypothetical protein